MTLFLALCMVLVLGIWSKPRKHKSKGTVRCVYLLWCFRSNLEYHLNIEVWNSFLILSFLSAFLNTVDACIIKEAELKELHSLILQDEMKQIFNKSDADLYAPNGNICACSCKLLHCYLLELWVIVHEEYTTASNNSINKIFILKEKYKDSSNTNCADCETHPVVNSTVFSERIQDFVKQQHLCKHNTHA